MTAEELFEVIALLHLWASNFSKEHQRARSHDQVQHAQLWRYFKRCKSSLKLINLH